MICNCLCDVIFSFECLIAMYIVNLLSACDFSAFVIPKESLPRHSNQLRFFLLSFSLKRETQNVLVSPIFLEQAKRKKKKIIITIIPTNKQEKKKRNRKARFIL